MTKVIMIGGKKRTGKGEATKYLKSVYEQQDLTVVVLPIAQPLKCIIADLFEISLSDLDMYKNQPNKYWVEVMEKGTTTLQQTDFRRLLQLLGTDIRNKYFGETLWVNMLITNIKQSGADIVLVDDWRFPFEYTEVAKQFPVASLIIKRDTGSADDHPSETSLDTFVPDFTISNSGSLEDFKGKLFKIQHLLR